MKPSPGLFAGIIGAGLTVYSIFVVLPYYPLRIGITVLLVLAALSALTVWRARWGVIFLFASGPFFGNHPGGRLMELYPILALLILSLLLIQGAIQETVDPSHPRSARGFFVLAAALFMIPVFVAALAQPWPLIDSLHRERDLFHVLTANEHSPLYPAQQGIWTAVLCLLAFTIVQTRANPENSLTRPEVAPGYPLNSTYANSALAGVTAGLFFTVLIGLLESTLPPVARSLDSYHLWLDGYVDRHPPHFLAGILSTSPNSLFWNRSWHAVYLISALPLASLFLERKKRLQPRTLRLIGLLALIAGFVYLTLLGARGALLAYGAFFVAAGPFLLLQRQEARPTGRLWLSIWPILSAIGALLIHVGTPLASVLLDLGLSEPRFAQYAAGLRIFLLFPFTGGGIESYGYYNTNSLQAVGLAAPNGTAHSQWLQILSGLGIPGGGAYLLLLLLAIAGPSLELVRLARSVSSGLPGGALSSTGLSPSPSSSLEQKPLHRSWAGLMHPTLLLAGLAAILIYSTFQEWWYLKPVQAGWWLLIALAIARVPEEVIVRTSFPGLNKDWGIWILSGALILAVILMLSGPQLASAAYRYGRIPRPAPESLANLDGEVSLTSLPALPEAHIPVLTQGVEYAGEGRFLVLAGRSWVALPRDMDSFRAGPAMKDNRSFSPVSLRGGWMKLPEDLYPPASDASGKHPMGVLVLECTPNPELIQRERDYDGRKLCAELSIPAVSELWARSYDGQQHRLR